MKSTIKQTTALLLVMANVLTVPALAAPDKGKDDKTEKKGSMVSSEAAVISLAQAKEIALADAGVEGAGVSFTKEDLVRTTYKLKFRNPEAKYEYEISALDGSILYCRAIPEETSDRPQPSDREEHLDREDPDKPHAPDLEERGDREFPVSADQARQIALDDAGLGDEELKYVTSYLSWSDHVPCAHEVKFSTRTEHYHYTIDLNDGAILDSGSQPRG